MARAFKVSALHNLREQRRTRCRQCRSCAIGTCCLAFVFWANYSARCFVSNTVKVVPYEQYCRDGREFLDPQCSRPLGATNGKSVQPPQPPVLQDVVESGMMYTNMPEFEGRRTHFESFVSDIGYFHAVRFDSACPLCSKADGKALSHVRIIMRISEEVHDRFVLVFEDDIELAQLVSRDSFVAALDHEIKHVLTPTDDIAYLGVCLSNEMEATCSARRCQPFGTFAYMLTPRGARTIIRKLESKYEKHHLEYYKEKSIDINQLLGAAPVIGWNYTHDYVGAGWRGMFYQSRKPPWRFPAASNATLTVTFTHTPKDDMLGSFVTPTFFLLAVVEFHGWHMEIMPYKGSRQEQTMIDNLAKGDKMESPSGGALSDASNRKGYDPMKINAESYDTLGFFQAVRNASFFKEKEWLQMEEIPSAGRELSDECGRHERKYRLNNECNIMLPDSPWAMEGHMKRNGGYEAFFTPAFCEKTRITFLEKNKHRLKHFNGGGYHVAIHIRRGDIFVNKIRWVEQWVYAKVARHICSKRPEANIHVFSSGKNPDGNWSAMENVTQGDSKCASLVFHLDEDEFDTWTHMVAADALVMSKSNFALIPSILTKGDVYYPSEYWHLRMKRFLVYDSVTGDMVKDVSAS